MEKDKVDFLIYVIPIIPILFFCILAFYLNIVRPFLDNRQYIKLEIHRAYNEEELRYWKKRLKRLYAAHIPIIGRLIVKIIDN